MTSGVKVSKSTQEITGCPICRSRLNWLADQLQCSGSRCGAVFPIVDGVPILINEKQSVFSIGDYTNHRSTTFDLTRFEASRRQRVWRAIKEYSPEISKNLGAKENYANFARCLKESSGCLPRVLIVGGGI